MDAWAQGTRPARATLAPEAGLCSCKSCALSRLPAPPLPSPCCRHGLPIIPRGAAGKCCPPLLHCRPGSDDSLPRKPLPLNNTPRWLFRSGARLLGSKFSSAPCRLGDARQVADPLSAFVPHPPMRIILVLTPPSGLLVAVSSNAQRKRFSSWKTFATPCSALPSAELCCLAVCRC